MVFQVPLPLCFWLLGFSTSGAMAGRTQVRPHTTASCLPQALGGIQSSSAMRVQPIVGKLRQPPGKAVVEDWDGAKEQCSQPQHSLCTLTSPSESAFRATGTVQRESSSDTELRYMQANTWGHRQTHANNLPCTDGHAWSHVGKPFAHTQDSHTHSEECAHGIVCPRAGMTMSGRAT